ncbi:MAG: DNA-3-methyladenine glycosylase [Treponema sp.]|jgi:DNA-3-methyladenine glycosylase|nr:DNA-3-methyladenine glycosylase [Treponema sp.]
MGSRLTAEMYRQDALVLAPQLMGMILCRTLNNSVLKQRITEVECYTGESDTACHAHKAKTERTKVMYRQGGIAYIYLCYGVHWMLNIVTGKENDPQAILIRGVAGCDGPGKLTRFLHIDKTLNEENLITSTNLWFEYDNYSCTYTAKKRVGIDYATEEYKNKLWRFVME